MSSGEEIFNRLQRRADEAQVSREAAAAESQRRWENATLEVLPRYRETALVLANGIEHLMTRITLERPKMTGVFKKRQARNSSKIPQWEEGEHTAGWYILSRTEKTTQRGDHVYHEFALFLLHDKQFLETSHTLHRIVDAGVLTNGQLSGGAITANSYLEGTGFLDDRSVADRYLRPDGSSFESGFARLFQSAGLEMPGNLRLPEG